MDVAQAHYHVISNDPGCMPDSHDIYDDFGTAVEEAGMLAQTFYGEGDTVVNSAHVDWEREYAAYSLRRSGTPRGWITHVIEVESCVREDCVEGGDDLSN